MIPYGKQSIDHDDIEEVIKVLKSDFITQGPKIEEFEDKLAAYCGAKYAVTFNSGTSALHAAYFAGGLKVGDEFITTPITFVATANAGLYLGAKPVFVDVEPDTGNIDPHLIESAISEKTKMIVPVHYAGHPCNMEKIKEIADKYDLIVIEDGCHALGAKYKLHDVWVKVGSCKFSDMTVFSFHPVKHITTGEGGAVLTNSDEYYEILKMFRNHGITKDKNKFCNGCNGDWYYEMQFLGCNYRMTDIQAALGLSQLKRLNEFVRKRRKIAQNYNKILHDNKYFYLPIEKDYASHSYHLYSVRLNDKYKNRKKEIFQKLRENGIGVQVHYIPVYYHPYYEKLGYKKGICAKAEDFYKREISLPLYPELTDFEIKFIVKNVLNIL